MNTFCVRQGQVEVGVIEYQGHQYSALGASVSGRNITGYTRQEGNDIQLASWCGKSMLVTRCEIVERYWSGSMALLFRLTKGNFIVGYSLGEGMLFRGELLTDIDDDEARSMARMISECFSDLDAEEEENFNHDE